MNLETKVGAFAMAGLALFGAGILILGDVNFKDRYPLDVYFASAEGLPKKGPVKVSGVEVGTVKRIELAGQRARVTIELDKSIRVHADAKATIASTGLIGTKYLDLSLGSDAAPLLERGGALEGENTPSFDEIMKKLGDFFKDDPVHGNASDNLRATLANLKQVSEALNGALGRHEEELEEIVMNVRGLSAHARNISADLDEVLSGHKQDLKITLEKVRSASERLDALLARIQSGEGTVGKLMSDKQMGDDLKETMASVKDAAKDAKKVLGRIALIDVYWDYRQRYDFEEETFRADLGLRIVPKPGKYYFIQGNNLGKREDRKADPDADLEKRNTITAVMGKDFGPVTLYGGAIRSSGGAGVRFRPLYKVPAMDRRVELEAEAYDFGRDEVVRGRHFEGPVYNVGARYWVRPPWFWVGGQLEDAAERRNFNANVNISFKDEDIAYLLGLAGLARP